MDSDTYITLFMPEGMLSGWPLAALIAGMGVGVFVVFVLALMAKGSPPMTKRWRK